MIGPRPRWTSSRSPRRRACAVPWALAPLEMREGDDAVESFDTGAGSDYACSVHAGRREQAMKDLTVILENRPGRLADLGEAKGRAGVNIEGVCGTTEGGQGVIHVLVGDAEPALAGPGALRQATGPELPPVEAALAGTWER